MNINKTILQDTFGKFELSYVSDKKENPYLRFGYWKQVDINKLQELIGEDYKVIEKHDYDDECGYMFHYSLI